MKILSKLRLQASMAVADNPYYRMIVKTFTQLFEGTKYKFKVKKVNQDVDKIKYKNFLIFNNHKTGQRVFLEEIPFGFGINGLFYHAPRYVKEQDFLLDFLNKGLYKSIATAPELEASSFNHFNALLDDALHDSRFSCYLVFLNEKIVYELEDVLGLRKWKKYCKGIDKARNVLAVICRHGKNGDVFNDDYKLSKVLPLDKISTTKNRSKTIQFKIFQAYTCKELVKADYELFCQAVNNPLTSYIHKQQMDSITVSNLPAFLAVLKKKQYMIMPNSKNAIETYQLKRYANVSSKVLYHYTKVVARNNHKYTLNWFILEDGQIIRFLFTR